MKILYAIQGTGNGHLARAIDIYPQLAQYGTTDVLISGIQSDISLPFPVKYKLYGLSFIFGKHGGVDRWQTFKRMRPLRLLQDIVQLPIQEYDLVINDFEPVSAWACRLYKKPCIALSHQSSVMHRKVPPPVTDSLIGRMVLKYYAPFTTAYGFHFTAFSKQVFTPVIRKEIRLLTPVNEGHYTVYLPAYDDNTLVRELSQFPYIRWQVFSKHCQEAFSFKNIDVRPVDNETFRNSMAAATGVLCGAGFETPAEALFLGKKLLVVPMSGQLEQQYNAAFLAGMGVPVVPALHKKHKQVIKDWLLQEERITVNYPDNSKHVVSRVMEDYLAAQLQHYPLSDPSYGS